MSWLYKGKKLNKIPKDAYGFTYIISYIGEDKGEIKKGKIYIGKKILNFSKKKRLTKKEKLLPENKRKKYKIEVKESDWKEYWGSSINLQKDIKQYGIKNFEREILKFHKDKINLTYDEVATQIAWDVLRRDTWNISILGKFFKGRIK